MVGDPPSAVLVPFHPVMRISHRRPSPIRLLRAIFVVSMITVVLIPSKIVVCETSRYHHYHQDARGGGRVEHVIESSSAFSSGAGTGEDVDVVVDGDGRRADDEDHVGRDAPASNDEDRSVSGDDASSGGMTRGPPEENDVIDGSGGSTNDGGRGGAMYSASYVRDHNDPSSYPDDIKESTFMDYICGGVILILVTGMYAFNNRPNSGGGGRGGYRALK